MSNKQPEKKSETNMAAVLASMSVIFFALGAPMMNTSKWAGAGFFLGGLVLIGSAGYTYRVQKSK